MINFKLTYLLLFIAIYSCGQTKHKTDPAAVALANKVIWLTHHTDNPDSCKKALAYLDSATAIDNNCFTCHFNKLMFLPALNRFDKAVIAIDNCIRIRPNMYDLYLTGGLLYERTGDSITSKKYFRKSLLLLNPVLDTMKAGTLDYDGVINYKVMNLIMLGKTKEGNELLKAFSNTETGEEFKKNALTMMQSNKKELIEQMTGGKTSDQ